MKKEYIDEKDEWLSLTPAQRIIESGNLWKLYLSLGGNLDTEPDTQSPFYFQKIRKNKKIKNIGSH